MEARREKLLVTIERAERTFEKHDKAAKRWLKRLAVMNGKKRRADKAIAKAKAEAASALVEPVTVETDHLPEPAFEQLAEKMVDEANGRLKAKRQRKAKAPTAEVKAAAEELAQSDLPRLASMFPFGKQAKLSTKDREQAVQLAETSRDEKRKRMKAMGFRPTKS